jgi:arylsulfatase A-like enzyme
MVFKIIKEIFSMKINYLKGVSLVLGVVLMSCKGHVGVVERPNVVFVFADQWRAQATGYAGDPNLQNKTPHLDRLAEEGINLVNTVSTVPVCTPYRASLLTGQYALSHGLFLNDAPLNPELTTIGKAYKAAGYSTGYVGKWHVDGHGRSEFIPKERQQGFDYWKVLECTHNYNKSFYYEGNDPVLKKWDGYDAYAQTQDVKRYITEHASSERPFAVFLSWGPPHNPYNEAPSEYQSRFAADSLELRPNVPEKKAKKARKDLAGYYAHIAALDDCFGELLATVDAAGLRDNTIFVVTSDHGDMLGSQGQDRKQRPYDESVRVPFLLRYPEKCGKKGREIDMPLGTPDIMPTILGLCGISIPKSVEGTDYSPVLTGDALPSNDAALIECLTPFGEWTRKNGGREYRGLRTRRYTYVRDLEGPWLLFDNQVDPYQMKNLVQSPEHETLRQKLDAQLMNKLKARKDEFLPGEDYIEKWGYKVGKNGTIQYKK